MPGHDIDTGRYLVVLGDTISNEHDPLFKNEEAGNDCCHSNEHHHHGNVHRYGNKQHRGSDYHHGYYQGNRTVHI